MLYKSLGGSSRCHEDIKVLLSASGTRFPNDINIFGFICILRNGEKTEDASAMLVFLNIKAMCNEDIDTFVEFVHTDNMKFMSEDTAAIDKEIQGTFRC